MNKLELVVWTRLYAMDLTKYRVITNNQDHNFQQGNSIYDLQNEMNNQGLYVSQLDLTGQVTRVPVKSAPGVRPDKGNERSGWYVINELD